VGSLSEDSISKKQKKKKKKIIICVFGDKKRFGI